MAIIWICFLKQIQYGHTLKTLPTYSPYYPTGSSVHTAPLPFSSWWNVCCAETHRLPNNPTTSLSNSKVCTALDHWFSLVGGTWRVRPHSLLKPRSNSKWNTICGDFGHCHSLSVIHQWSWIPSNIASVGRSTLSPSRYSSDWVYRSHWIWICNLWLCPLIRSSSLFPLPSEPAHSWCLTVIRYSQSVHLGLSRWTTLFFRSSDSLYII